MRSFRRSMRLTVAVAVLLSGPAMAQTSAPVERSFSPQIFHAAPGPDEFVTVEPAAPLRHKGWGVGLYFNYARNMFSIFSYDPVKKEVGDERANFIKATIAADVWAAIGLWNRFQIALALPMALYQTGDNFSDPNL